MRNKFVFKTDSYVPILVHFTMPCPVCSCNIGEADHRMCLVELFRNDTIKSVADWEKMCKPCKPKTIRKGKIIAYLPKSLLEPSK